MPKVVILGLTAHGKTTYLNSLMVFVENLAKISSGSYYEYLTEYTLESVRQIRALSRSRELPNPTVIGIQPALSIRIGNFINNAALPVEIFDPAGEIFEALGVTQYSDLLKSADSVWLLVSLGDLERSGERSLLDVFNSFLAAARKSLISLKQKQFTVVLTKADIVSNLPENIRSYLINDPYANIEASKSKDLAPLNVTDYLERVKRVSMALEQYLMAEVAGGAALINIARANGIELNFSITSSSGYTPTPDNALSVQIHRYRILDPLILSLAISGETRLADIITQEKAPVSVQAQSLESETIFISYKRIDWAKFVDPLVKRLHKEGLSVWVDKHLIEGGSDWQDEIDKALRICNRMIVCVSPEALDSKYVKLEYRYFWNNNKKLYPIICREAELPPILQSIQYYSYKDMEKLVNILHG